MPSLTILFNQAYLRTRFRKTERFEGNTRMEQSTHPAHAVRRPPGMRAPRAIGRENELLILGLQNQTQNLLVRAIGSQQKEIGTALRQNFSAEPIAGELPS